MGAKTLSGGPRPLRPQAGYGPVRIALNAHNNTFRLDVYLYIHASTVQCTHILYVGMY